jgi:NIPSNAP
MKRILFFVLIILTINPVRGADKPSSEYYQLTVYHYATDSQALVIEQYLQEALIPALHRNGISNVGVFKAIANDTSANKLLYVFLPLKKLESLELLNQQLNKDQLFLSSGKTYRDAFYTHPPYTRMEVILLKAFPLAPEMQLPQLKGPKSERVYELRSYESATEKIFANKVKMFNEGDEIGLFKRLNFNAVFYSSVIAGSKMPNLMYMTCFENKAERDEHWKSFSQDPYWKKLSSMPEYQKNVSHIDIIFLRPTSYSDF